MKPNWRKLLKSENYSKPNSIKEMTACPGVSPTTSVPSVSLVFSFKLQEKEMSQTDQCSKSQNCERKRRKRRKFPSKSSLLLSFLSTCFKAGVWYQFVETLSPQSLPQPPRLPFCLVPLSASYFHFITPPIAPPPLAAGFESQLQCTPARLSSDCFLLPPLLLFPNFSHLMLCGWAVSLLWLYNSPRCSCDFVWCECSEGPAFWTRVLTCGAVCEVAKSRQRGLPGDNLRGPTL